MKTYTFKKNIVVHTKKIDYTVGKQIASNDIIAYYIASIQQLNDIYSHDTVLRNKEMNSNMIVTLIQNVSFWPFKQPSEIAASFSVVTFKCPPTVEKNPDLPNFYVIEGVIPKGTYYWTDINKKTHYPIEFKLKRNLGDFKKVTKDTKRELKMLERKVKLMRIELKVT